MSPADAELLRHASALHDVGKVGIPDEILSKPGPLDDDEWETMKTHTTIGASILSGSASPLVQLSETIALTHHERWDGSGYPLGLRGEEIPLAGRICAICDVFDALLSTRPYKDPWPFDVRDRRDRVAVRLAVRPAARGGVPRDRARAVLGAAGADAGLGRRAQPAACG